MQGSSPAAGTSRVPLEGCRWQLLTGVRGPVLYPKLPPTLVRFGQSRDTALFHYGQQFLLDGCDILISPRLACAAQLFKRTEISLQTQRDTSPCPQRARLSRHTKDWAGPPGVSRTAPRPTWTTLEVPLPEHPERCLWVCGGALEPQGWLLRCPAPLFAPMLTSRPLRAPDPRPAL